MESISVKLLFLRHFHGGFSLHADRFLSLCWNPPSLSLSYEVTPLKLENFTLNASLDATFSSAPIRRQCPDATACRVRGIKRIAITSRKSDMLMIGQ